MDTPPLTCATVTTMLPSSTQRQRGFGLLEVIPIVIVLLIIVLLTAIVMSSFTRARAQVGSTAMVAGPSVPSPIRSETRGISSYRGYVMRTIVHDDHWFVWIEPKDNSGSAPTHHPACPCLAPKLAAQPTSPAP
jgi:hypothetical protein